MSKENDLRDGLLTRTMRLLEARIEGLEEMSARDLGKWNGYERRQDGTAFSDEQVRRIKELFDERAEVHAGRAFIRLVVWALGSAVVGAASVLLAYLKFKA